MIADNQPISYARHVQLIDGNMDQSLFRDIQFSYKTNSRKSSISLRIEMFS